jgi:phage tail sheath protein FI
MPAAMLRAVTRAALDYCAGKGDCMYVGHTPEGRDGAGAKAFGQDFRAAKVYGALYWPWVTVSDPAGAGPNPTRVVPPSGHVMGVYARVEQSRGVWKAPAGDEAIVRGALAVEQDVTDEDHTDLVKNGSINGIRPIRGTGIVIDASRTLSTDTRWLYVNVRLLFNFVKASLRDGLRWVRQEPNRDALWNMVKFNTVTPFLLGLHQQGAFGTGTPAQVFTVICGAENNPPEEVTLGNLRVEVYFYPSRPAETILIVIGQQPSGASAGER